LDRDDTVKSGKLLDTPNNRTSMNGFYSSSSSTRHHHHHHRHHRKSEYFPKEFKKSKPRTFDGEMKKIEDAEACLLGMRKFLDCMDT